MNPMKSVRQAALATALLTSGLLVSHSRPVHAQTVQAQTAPASGGPVDPARIQELVIANHVLTDLNVIDGFGHISMRHPGNPDRYLLSRSVAPALVTADDIMEYDLDSVPVDARGRNSFFERYIHGEIYKARPDVMAVIHTHSLGVIPFGIGSVPLRPVFLLGAFLSPSVPVFDIRKVAGQTNMLVGTPDLGKSLASTLGDRSVALLRGHGSVVVAATVPMAVFRAYYSNVNASLQSQAMSLGGDVNYMQPEESEKTLVTLEQIHGRAWDLWKRAALEKMQPK